MVKNLAGYAIDFSPYARHSLSNRLIVEIKFNPGDSFPVLAINLAHNKCENVGALPAAGCGVIN